MQELLAVGKQILAAQPFSVRRHPLRQPRGS